MPVSVSMLVFACSSLLKQQERYGETEYDYRLGDDHQNEASPEHLWVLCRRTYCCRAYLCLSDSGAKACDAYRNAGTYERQTSSYIHSFTSYFVANEYFLSYARGAKSVPPPSKNLRKNST